MSSFHKVYEARPILPEKYVRVKKSSETSAVLQYVAERRQV